jgi:hypothetical protein
LPKGAPGDTRSGQKPRLRDEVEEGARKGRFAGANCLIFALLIQSHGVLRRGVCRVAQKSELSGVRERVSTVDVSGATFGGCVRMQE